MRPFEESHTAWLDGELSGTELVEFEKELEKRGEPISQRGEFLTFRALLMASSEAPILDNPDFFNHGIREQIEKSPSRSGVSASWWGIPRLAWLGGFSTAVAFALFLAVIPKKSETHSPAAYMAQVISARSADPHISATAFQTDPKGSADVTVVWLDGLDYVPAQAQ